MGVYILCDIHVTVVTGSIMRCIKNTCYHGYRCYNEVYIYYMIVTFPWLQVVYSGVCILYDIHVTMATDSIIRCIYTACYMLPWFQVV